MMTRKHYEAVAKAIRESAVDAIRKHHLAVAMANEIGKFNPNFNRGKFLEDCQEK